MTDEQIDKIAEKYTGDSLNGITSYREYARDILSAAIPEGCGVWREEKCVTCGGGGSLNFGEEYEDEICGTCGGDGVVPVERLK